MGGEIHLGAVNKISIMKSTSIINKLPTYDLTFNAGKGETFHLTEIDNLPELLKDALENIKDFDEILMKIKETEESDGNTNR